MKLLPLLFLTNSALWADQAAHLSLYAKGVYAERSGDFETALKLYQKTYQKDPHAFPLATKVSSLQSQNKDLAAATSTLRDFAKSHRKHLPSQIHYSRFLRQTAPHDALAQDAARDTLLLANKNFPHQPSIYEPLINLLELQQNRDSSLAVLNEQLAAQTDDPHHWFALAPIIQSLYPADSTEYEEKLAYTYQKASVHGLSTPYIARKISDYYRDSGKMTEAIATLQKHLKLSPSSHSLRTHLALLYLSNKQEDLGEKTLLEVIAIDADQSLAHQSLAKFYEKKKNPLKALHHRAELFRIEGSSPDDATKLANEYLDLNLPHEARLLMEKARFHFPESPAIIARLAIATLRDGLTEEAALLFRQAESLAQKYEDSKASEYLDSDFQMEFAQSLLDAGDIESAVTRLRQVAQNINVDEEPTQYARAITALAKVWIQQEKNEGPAKALLERALSIDPDHKEAKALLEKFSSK